MDNETFIGEIIIAWDSPQEDTGSIAFKFRESITEDLDKEENEEIRLRVIEAATLLHEALVELLEK